MLPRQLQVDIPRLPAIAFLTAKAFPAVIPVMVCGSAVFKIMRMIRDQMSIDSLVFQHIHNGDIKGFQRSPAAVKKIQLSGMQLTPGRHARHASSIKMIESDAVFFQPLKIRRDHPVVAIVRQIVAGQGVKHDHDCAHSSPPEIFFFYPITSFLVILY
ncbi:hypothetical protein HOLDEFILI_01065 [Holdemania filiformis DSM 12042]|uniref:Uncharacterized protein n=1 Tax=Holdemania filiformis DSM 12042 TaxID=545696 RepID=B9Y5I3_9FIRM|nr:hypothetical protein HOLDEFILI_01065 [Holdemania filiformis DSM 12042]